MRVHLRGRAWHRVPDDFSFSARRVPRAHRGAEGGAAAAEVERSRRNQAPDEGCLRAGEPWSGSGAALRDAPRRLRGAVPYADPASADTAATSFAASIGFAR